jgi:Fe-S-cluster containining protein
VSTADELRLSRGLGIPLEVIRQKVTKDGLEKGTRIMRHKDDAIFASVCRFLDSDTRRCTVYKHRPRACREYPGTGRCGYYDFLSAERQRQENPALVMTAWETDLG